MFRLIATIMALFLSCASSCLPVLAIESSQRPPAAAEKPRKPIGSVSAQERAARHTAKKLQLSLPASPSDAELECCHIFPEPFTPLVAPEVSGENASLSRALTAFNARKNVDDLSALQLFVKTLPTSRWNASLELNMAILRQESGRTADALSLFKSAWDKSKSQTGKPQSLIAQRAISELLYIQGTLGRVEDLKKGLAEVGKRPMQGSAQQRLAAVRDTSWSTIRARPFVADHMQ